MHLLKAQPGVVAGGSEAVDLAQTPGDIAIGIVVVDTSFVFHYFRVMKNVTVTLPEDVARWLRVRAAESERSVSKWLADLLQSMKRREDEYEVAMERFLARRPWKMEWVDGRKPTRDELHHRAGLR